MPYPFELTNLHCGIAPDQFDYALFIPTGSDEVTPQLTGFGTMTLTDPYHAHYRDQGGAEVSFVAVSSVQVPLCA